MHLLWIPAFPIGKTSITTCQHCKQVLYFREMPATYQWLVQEAQHHARTPRTQFSLLLLFGAYATISLTINWVEKRKEADQPSVVQEPSITEAAGQRYKVNVTDDGRQYGLIEVTAVTADSVEYRMTNILINTPTPASVTQALHDSVSPTNAHQRATLEQWEYSAKQGFLKPLRY
ncbi:hypothetical protein GCM10022409_10510 [Hymenobacter glaciei]|uniref:Uncharacterized protein n=1 Tax=Hymenobacter glaciei TaxID=877209 RepID=A0ABP7TMB0_9BACT